jgi:small basic protein
MLIFDFSKAGWKLAVKEFFLSLVKTVVAAAIVYIGVKLNNLDVSTFVSPEYAVIGTAVIGLVRAGLTSIYKWATTIDTIPAGTQISEVA